MNKRLKGKKEKDNQQSKIPLLDFNSPLLADLKFYFDAVDLILNGYDEACVVSRRQNHGLYA